METKKNTKSSNYGTILPLLHASLRIRFYEISHRHRSVFAANILLQKRMENTIFLKCHVWRWKNFVETNARKFFLLFLQKFYVFFANKGRSRLHGNASNDNSEREKNNEIDDFRIIIELWIFGLYLDFSARLPC